MDKEQETKVGTKSRSTRIFRGLMKVFIVFCLFLLVFYALLRIPAIQNYLKEKIIDAIEVRTGAKVTYDHLVVSIWSGITMENLTLQDEKLDSIIRLEKIGLSLRKNLFFLFNNELDISKLRLEGLRLDIVTRYMENESNLDRFLKKLLNQGKDGPKKEFFLSVGEVFLKDIYIRILNENKGVAQYIGLNSGLVELEKVDLMCNSFLINQLYLNQPVYQKTVFSEVCYKPGHELTVKSDEPVEKDDWFPFSFYIDKINIENGRYGMFDELQPVDTKFLQLMDYRHFKLDDINVNFSKVELKEDDTFFALCESVSFKNDRGFELKNFSIDTIDINKEGAILKNVTLETKETLLESNIKFNFYGYEAFRNIKEEVTFSVDISPSAISMKDLSHFLKALIVSPVTQGINDKTINLSGRYYGNFTGINGRDVNIDMDRYLSLTGSFSTKNLDDYNNTLLNVRLDNFNTSMNNVKKLFPTFNIPKNFYKLGNISFSGRYDGYIEDFVAYGNLNTDLGNVNLDMRLDLTPGIQKAQYSGELNVNGFNLKKWTDNDQFGLVYFTSKVKKGQGLTLATLKSDLSAVVTSLTFKDYVYKNFSLNGVFEKNNFKGFFEIHDPNIDLKFDGNAEFIDNQAFLNFTSKIKNLDLYALNLNKKPLSFSADLEINASGSNINDVLGEIDVQNVRILSHDTTFIVEEMHLSSKNMVTGGKELKIWSELGHFHLSGLYDLTQVGPLVTSIIKKNYPILTKNWKAKEANPNIVQKMDFDINLNHSKHFLTLAGLKNVSFSKLELKGKIDSEKNEFSLASGIPLIQINRDSVQNIQLLVNSYKNSGNILLHADKANISKRKLGSIDFQANSLGDSILFEISGNEILKGMKPLDIQGRMTPFENGFAFQLLAEKLHFFGKDWKFLQDNSLAITNEKLVIRNFELTDGFRTIGIENYKKKGLIAFMDNFDIDVVNDILKDKRFVLSGLSKVQIDVEDIFAKEKEIYASVRVPNFYINKDAYGSIDISADVNKTGQADIDLTIGEFVSGNVLVDTKNKTIQGKAKLREAPLRILEYILNKGVANTSGTVDAIVDISGGFKDFILDGKGKVNNGQTKIVYTGVTYFFDQQSFVITEKKIDFTGALIRDSKNNVATITGGLTHNRFRTFGVNTVIAGDNVIGLQTTKADNPDYYGYAIGKLRASFNGGFDKVDMVIDAVTNQGTQLNIPVGNSGTKSNSNVIRFEKRNMKGDSVVNIANKLLKGIDLEMNLTLTPDAQVSIIFNEDKGDIIKGQGRGNMQIFIKRTGGFDIFGDYQIESGNYLFTVAQLPVAKPFVVYRGGLIRWTGDPVNASLDIKAVYKSRTSLQPFIEEYLGFASETLVNQASQRQDVDVILNLGGTLFRPEVTFNLAFPNLVGDLATLADSKMRILQNNELELNSQVFGLIMFNNFLPSNRVSDVIGSGGIQSIGINTLSEFLSSQLSLYITNLINLALVENGLLAGVDFEIGLRSNTGVVSNLSNSNVWPDEIEFRLKNRFKFLDERITLNMGGNYIFENQGLTYNQMLPDFSLELVLTENRKLKARVYGRQELIVQNTLSPKVGLGLTYRTEFGTLTSFEESLKSAIKKAVVPK